MNTNTAYGQDETGSRNSASKRVPRFSTDTLNGVRPQTATHHSLSTPNTLGMSGDDPAKRVPGAFPGEDDDDDTTSGTQTQGRASQLPTTEQPTGSRIGVGSLPGKNAESDVAVLPEERAGGRNYGQGNSGFLGSDNLKGPVQSGKIDSSRMPTTEDPSGSLVGIGSMPGRNRESGVATLPEERFEGRPYGHGRTGFEADYPGNSGANVSQTTANESQNEGWNPLSHPGHRHGTGELDSKPGDTIFSATQREKAYPTTGGDALTRGNIDDTATTSPEQRGDMLSRLGDAIFGTSNAVGRDRFEGNKVEEKPLDDHTSRPGDTIFSATQREKAHHGASATNNTGHSHEQSATSTAGQQGDMGSKHGDTIFSATQRSLGGHDAAPPEQSSRRNLQGPIDDLAESTPDLSGPNISEVLGDAAHTAGDVIHNVEGVAVGMIHGAEHMLANAGEAAKSYFSGGRTNTAARNAGDDIGTSGKADSSKDGTQTMGRNAPSPDTRSGHKLRDAINQVQGDQKSFTTSDSGSYTTSGENASRASASADQGLPDSLRAMSISGEPTTLPETLQKEYYASGTEFDMHGDSMDTDEFVYEDDEDEDEEVPGGKPAQLPDNDKDSVRNRAGGGYRAGDTDELELRSRTPGEGDIGVGYGGVTFNQSGGGGVLPGYPTPEGMDRLVSERIRDDALRAAGAHNPTNPFVGARGDKSSATRESTDVTTSGLTSGASNLGSSSGANERSPHKAAAFRPESTVSNRPVRGSHTPLTSGQSSPLRREITPEPSLDNRIIEEKREVPIFEGGGQTAAGKFEATFEAPGVGRSQEASKVPVAPGLVGGIGGGGLQAGYLGKPVSKHEEKREIENARLEMDRRLGIN